MRFLEQLYLAIDRFNNRLGRIVSWTAIIMVLVQFLIVVMRYIFNFGSQSMQDSVIYLHSILFLLGASYTLLHEGHVRVDIFYREHSQFAKAMVDAIGALVLLLPVCIFIWWWSWPYVVQSWATHETSLQTSGLPFVYILKTLILAFASLMAVQGVSMFLRSLLTLTGHNTRQAREDGAHV
ncbi:TRAP transporter small permease subunit [Magnetovibrio blakemorei]|uniref:TRAP transporter small permease protein n=1 Tax=Magnetovibrio blakemorei TaxID=28181 RepID=A0A1E5QBN5_9PROT|nr:TRAP transporter small permease subunit [Magnetovibrio blakemorei]OEJ69431.1 C4-dicarboxylate ABC transporter permease [Magnetovibrio blakemorei]